MTTSQPFSFDPIASKYLNLRPRDEDWWAVFNQLRHEIKLNRETRVLDLGCGAGPMSMALLETTENVFARDPSKEMVEQTLANTKRLAEVTQGHADDLPYPDLSFDAVVTWLSVHFWTEVSSFSEVFRVLKPDGKFGIVTFTQEHFENHWLGEYFPSIPKMEQARFRPDSEIRQLFDEVGFTSSYSVDLPRSEIIERSDALERVRSKYVSPLHLISQSEFEEGLRLMEQSFPDRIVREMGWQLIIANK